MATDGSDLRPGEVEITEHGEKLWRQVHPIWVQDGRVTSQLFSPTPKDSGELSVTRASIVSAKEAHQYHTEVMGLESIGVYGVEVAEVREVGLRAVDDAQADGAENRPPGHAYVDFKDVRSAGQRRKRASILRDRAENRGWQHGPTA
ncbi:hypothetical protein ACIQ8G_03085 [Streptomyces sp. NPDC094154]|uniref:hypothetical protein n=1 Tax=Streptomyces sp. NPDC094154 TaxID=3366059 RepID=UPI0038162680